MGEPGIFSTILSPIEGIINFAFGSLYSLTAVSGFPSYGVAIILLTVIVKVLLYPLTVKQMQSMKAMQKLQPQLKKIQEKYKDDKMAMQQKMAQLYQKEGVNPLAGCLPMLIQMPILMGMYYALFNFDYGGTVPSFLWLPSLSEPDPYYILPLLSALSTYAMQKMSMTESTPQMKMMSIFMPIFIGGISINFPAGLVLYWVTMNVVQIVQQWFIFRGNSPTSGKE